MIPLTAIPEAAARARPWARPLVIGPPPGVSDDDCGTVVALVEHLDTDGPFPDRIRVPLQLEDGELDALAAGAPVWLTVYGVSLQPFSLSVG